MLTMKQFRRLVDAEISRLSGLSLACLADFDLWDYFDEELTADEARGLADEVARMVLAENGFPQDAMLEGGQ